MGWLVCVFQWTVCVWVFCGDSADWWLRVFQLSEWHTSIYFRILIPHLHNKMRRNVDLHFVTLFMLLIHCVAR